MGDENPIRTLRDYSKPSQKSYRNTIELPDGNNMVPLRSDTIWLVQNGCSFHRLRSEDPNQHLKDYLKLVDSLDLDVANRERTRLRLLQISLRDQASNWLERKLHDRNAEESWALLEDPALYDNESWNDPRDFAKLVKAISLPQDVSSTSDRRLIELENQVQRLMEAHLAPKQPVQMKWEASDARLSKFEADFKQQQSEMTNKIDTVLKAITDRITRALPSDTVKNPKLNVNSTSAVLSACYYPTEDPQCSTQEEEEKCNPKNVNTTPPSPPDPSISFIIEKVHKLNSFLESSGLVPRSSNIKFVCTKEDDGDVMFIEIIKKYDDSRKEELEEDENAMT
ncbi:hypothetical protein Tco_0688888 [Tanacetum coccineum]